MKLVIRTLLLLSIGTVLAFSVTWVVGWFAAIAIPVNLARTMAGSEVLANLVYVFGMRAVPAGALSIAFGLMTAISIPASRLAIVGLCSLPWMGVALAGAVAIPYSSDASILDRAQVLLSWQLWPAILAVPVGLSLAVVLCRRDHHR